MNHSPK